MQVVFFGSIYVVEPRPQWPILLGKQQCFFGGEISPDFALQNMISTYTKDLTGETQLL
jgi:hypothetical protein